MKLNYPYFKLNLNIKSTDLLPNFWFSLILTILMLLLASGIFHFIPVLISSWLQFIFTTLIVSWCGLPIFKKGWLSLIERRLDMFTLITIATIVTYAYGAFILFFSDIFPNMYANTDILFETVAVIVSIVWLEQIFEAQVWKKVKETSQIVEQMPSPIEKKTQLLSHYVICAALLIAISTFIFTMDMTDGFISAISVLVIACPRAITLSAPIAMRWGIKRLEKSGVTFNEPECLVRLEKAKVLIVDKDSVTEPSASSAFKLLRKEGFYIIMITSDDYTTAENIAKSLGIEAIETATSPQHKQEVAIRLTHQGFRVATTTASDRGMTLELYNDLNDQITNIRFPKNDLLDLVRARQLSKKVKRNILQNLLFAFIYNLLFIPIAAGVYYHLTGSPFNPMLAAILMLLCTTFVMINALRL
ncbi:MAG: P-type ATPase [Gammaproteobacteria bacterium]